MRRVLLVAEWQVSQLVRGVVDYARSHDWHLVIWHAGDAYEAVRAFDGDGIIGNSTAHGLFAPANVGQRPVRLVSCVPLKYNSIPYTLVREDDAAIGRLAADYFFDAGFVNFACFSSSARGREFLRVVSERNARSCRHLATTASYEGLVQWLRTLPEPCALFAENDWDGSAVINAALLNGIDIPGRLSVLSVGNDYCVCHASSIALSSIDSRLWLVGYTAAAELERLLNGGEVNREGIAISPAPLPIERQSMDFAVRTDPRLREIVEYMKSSISQPMTMYSIAWHFGLSVSSLYKLFVNHFGEGPKQILLKLRLRHVDGLLRENKLPLKEISSSAGFPTATAFFSAFRRFYGCTPKQWRDSLEQQ